LGESRYPNAGSYRLEQTVTVLNEPVERVGSDFTR